MQNELVVVPLDLPAIRRVATPAEVLEQLLRGLSPKTVKAYTSDLRDFARFLGLESAADAADQLLAAGQGAANGTAHAYRSHLGDRGLAPKTIARRLAALRSVVTFARTLGVIDWQVDCRAPRAERRRDTRGPDRAGMRRVWKVLDAAGDGTKARRDRALVALLYDLALRRGEVLALDLVDVDLRGGTVAIVGKGRTEKERLTLPAPTAAAVATWIQSRGPGPGPLFHRLDRGVAGDLGRLTGDAVEDLLAAVGIAAGLPRPLRPHGLRHAAITEALEQGVDIRDVRKYSRHAKLETVLLYDDDRSDVAGKIARKVSGGRR